VREPVFSLIVPTRCRTAQLRRLLDSVRNTTSDLEQVEVVLVVDSDDEESQGFRYDAAALKSVVVPPGLTMGALNMAGYRAASGRYLMLLNDDVVLRTPGWDRQVFQVFRDVPDGMALVHVNDLVFQDTLCIFPFLTREFCSLAGGICEEGYQRYRIDDHIHNIFDLVSILGHNRRMYLPGIIFEHTNVGQTETGAPVYVPDPELHDVDTKLFHSLLDDRKRIALEVADRIQSRRNSEQRSIRQAKLGTVTDSVAIRRPEHARRFPAVDASGKTPRVTIGVVSGNFNSRHAQKCLELVKACTSNFELILIDNNRDPEFNHSREMNRLLSMCRTDYLVLMDDDVFVQPGWLEGLLRCLGPEIGVVTPLHLDKQGKLSYAGVVMCPDDTGHHTHILEAPDEPRRIQTLCSAVLLIDMLKCGHIRFDERYSKYFLDIDYGLHVWEEGFQVVCSPYSTVTHVGGATFTQGGVSAVPLLEKQRRTYLASWIYTRRIEALRRGAWRTIPEIQGIEDEAVRIDRILEDCGSPSEAPDLLALFDSFDSYPALQDYMLSRAFTLSRAEDFRSLRTRRLVALLEMHNGARTFEANFKGVNIVILPSYVFYGLTQEEDMLSYRRIISKSYNRSYEASSPDEIKEMIVQDVNTGKFPDGFSDEVRLMEAAGRCNILSVGARFAVVPWSLGAVDFRLPSHRERAGITWTESLPDAREAAEKNTV
jgi:GT2 family glycosyltransferase